MVDESASWGFYSSSRASGHPTGCQSASKGHPDFLVSSPNFRNSRRLLRHTGSRNPMTDRWPNDHRHGQFGCRAHHARNNSLNGNSVKCPGIIHSTLVIPPLEPATSCHAVITIPFPSPETTANRNVRVAFVMGMITIIRSTNRFPSSRFHSQSADCANSRSARTA